MHYHRINKMYLFNMHPPTQWDHIDFNQGGVLYFKKPFNNGEVLAEIRMPVDGWTQELLVNMEVAIASAHPLEIYDIFLEDRWVGSSEL